MKAFRRSVIRQMKNRGRGRGRRRREGDGGGEGGRRNSARSKETKLC